MEARQTRHERTRSFVGASPATYRYLKKFLRAENGRDGVGGGFESKLSPSASGSNTPPSTAKTDAKSASKDLVLSPSTPSFEGKGSNENITGTSGALSRKTHPFCASTK